MRGRPEPKSRKSGNHHVRRRNKAAHAAAARLVLESAAPVRDLRETLTGPRRHPSATRTVRVAPPAVPAHAASSAPAEPPRPSARPAPPPFLAEAVRAQAEHRAALLADRELLGRPSFLSPRPEASAAERSPPARLGDAERLQFQVRLCSAELFAAGLARIVDAQAENLWTVHSRIRDLEHAPFGLAPLGCFPPHDLPARDPGPTAARDPPAQPPPWASSTARCVVARGSAPPASPAAAGDTREVLSRGPEPLPAAPPS